MLPITGLAFLNNNASKDLEEVFLQIHFFHLPILLQACFPDNLNLPVLLQLFPDFLMSKNQDY